MSRKSRWGCLAMLLFALGAGGCYSLTQLRASQVIRTSGETQVVAVWFMAPGNPMGGGSSPVAEAATAVIFYPLDVLISTAVAVRALFHPGMDITWGPVGAVAGITLPWVTLIPHLYPPLCMLWPTPEVNLSPAEFQSLVARIRQGDGLSAYRELVDVELWACQDAVMMSVVLLEGRTVEAAQLGAGVIGPARHDVAR